MPASPANPADARSLRQGAQGFPRAGARAQEAAHGPPGRARDAAVRGRADDPLPDPGDAADREDVRGSGHRGRARRLQPARPRRLELQGDDADRVRGRRRAQARARAAARASRTASTCRSRAARASTRSPTRTCRARTTKRPSAVHFLRFELTPEMVAALKRGAGLGDRRRPSRVRGGDSRGRRRDARARWRGPRVAGFASDAAVPAAVSRGSC